MAPRMVEADDLAGSINAGENIFIPGSAGEPTDFVAALGALETRAFDIMTTFVPGINGSEMAGFGPDVRVSGLFMQPGLREAQAEGRYRHLPLSYYGLVGYIRDSYAPDIAIATLSQPNSEGRCSFGVAVEVTPQAMARARRRLAIINTNMPFVAGSESIDLSDIDTWAESDAPLKAYDTGNPSTEANAIAAHVAGLIRDGAAIQVGLGKVPDAILSQLGDRKGLRFHSGMLSDSAMRLFEVGATDDAWEHTCCVLVGSDELYRWSAQARRLSIRNCGVTHEPARLASIKGFVAINSALTVDLFGQCDLETANGRAVSSFGGAPDFARGGRYSEGGLSVVALPSSFTGSRGAGSRIVPALGQSHAVSIPRNDVDMIVTENGVADLRGRSVHERAEAIIAIAAPAFQAELTLGWREIRNRL